MSGNGVKVISAVMVEMLHEKSVGMVLVTVTGSGSRCRSWYSVSHTTDSVWASCPTQRPGNIR